MAEVKTGESIKSVRIGDVEHPIDAVTLDGKSSGDFQQTSNIVQEINASSDTTHYPSAKCMWDEIGDIKAVLESI